MIQRAAPAPRSPIVAAVGNVCRECVEASSGPLAQQMNDDLCTDQATDLVANANASILHDDVDCTGGRSAVDQQTPEYRKQYPELFVDGIRIEAVRDDQLRPRLTLRMQRRNDPRVIVAQPLAERRMGQIFVAVSRGCADANTARACFSDDAILESGVQRVPCVLVDSSEPCVGVRFIRNAEIEPALAQGTQPALTFFLEC